MPEEMEVPTEHLQESLKEAAEKSNNRWVLMVALTAAILAVLAAIASLLASYHVNEAMIQQLKASDQWAYYQAKAIKRDILESKIELLRSLDKRISAQDESKLTDYDKQRKDIELSAREAEKSSAEHMEIHHILARAVTIFQIAIAISAIAVLTRRKWMWYGSIILGMGGIIFLLQAIV
jgi:leucyl-tRNA synthetase